MTPGALWTELARRDRALAIGGLLMAIGFVAAAAAAPFDTRLILGINPWIKPMKFLSSIAIFLWTMAWFMAEAEPRFARRLAILRWTMLTTLFGEIALIVMQATRGTTSHFNDATPFDAAVFGIMGGMITCNTLAVGALLTALRREPAGDRAGYLWGPAARDHPVRRGQPPGLPDGSEHGPQRARAGRRAWVAVSELVHACR
ncbi:MAG: hypothetical protein OEW19_01225 [Acidobacteriota bacterium]|nr:hypothetical protein [Acidobacteriota bacterium]